MSDIQITFQPSRQDLNRIEMWMKDDWDNKSSGLYGSFQSIITSFDGNEMIVLLEDNQPISFVTWLGGDKVAKILCAQTQSFHQGRGCLRNLIGELFEKFKKSNYKLVYLMSSSPEAAKVWGRLHFKGFPKIVNFNSFNSPESPYLYKKLINVARTKQLDKGEFIQLHGCDKYLIDEQSKSWRWPIKYKKDSRNLLLPIISPVHRDWWIQWFKDGNVIAEAKVKNFLGGGVLHDCFMIIEAL